MGCHKIFDRPEMKTPHHLHCTVSKTGSLVLVGQTGSDPPPPHTPEAVTVTLQVRSPAREGAMGNIVAMSV